MSEYGIKDGINKVLAGRPQNTPILSNELREKARLNMIELEEFIFCKNNLGSSWNRVGKN